MDITKLDEETQKIIISAYSIGWSDGECQNCEKVNRSNEQLLEYLNHLINPKPEENA